MGEVTSLLIMINSSHSYHPEQRVFAFSLELRVGVEGPLQGGRLNSNVYDSDPVQGQTPPLHHILVIATVVHRVGLPAVLEVVCRHIVPAVLLLWAVRERH